jgi:hypothetical protein
MPAGQHVERHLGIAQDRGEQIIEIVGDPASELADALHLLRLKELCLEALTIGDIAADSNGIVVAITVQPSRVGFDPAPRAVGVASAHGNLGAALAAQQGKLLKHQRQIVGMH